jgi:hypothetical protein
MSNIEEDLLEYEENIIDLVEDEGDDLKNNQHLLYKNRIKSLIKDVAKSENFEGIALGKEAFERFQQTTKYMVVMLIFEIIKVLKDNNRRHIKPQHIDDALNKTIASADAIGVSMSNIEKLLKQLLDLNENTSAAKAMEFINFNNTQDGENKE